MNVFEAVSSGYLMYFTKIQCVKSKMIQMAPELKVMLLVSL